MMKTLRKFGLEFCDFPIMLWNIAILLRVLTLNIDKRYKEGIPLIFYFLTTVIAFCYFYVYLVSMVWLVFMKYPETGEVTAAMVIFSLGVSSEIGTTKLFFMFLNIDLIRDLVEGTLASDSIVVSGSRFDRNIRKTLRAVKKRAIIFWMVIMMNGVVYCVKPLIIPGRHIMEDSLIVYGLEPMYESPNYEIAFCITTCGVLFTCYLPANITALLIIISGYVEAQILALSVEITHLWDDAQEHQNNLRNEAIQNNSTENSRLINEFIKNNLNEIVKKHTMNINLLRQIENVFRGAVMVEFMLLVVGLIAELLGGLENTYIEIPFAVMQVAMDCLVGQRVMDASVAFENAIYNCQWENFDTANMRTILLMLQNSQKTLTLSAGGVTMLSFTSLMSLMKSVYSAYTTLRSTMNK